MTLRLGRPKDPWGRVRSAVDWVIVFLAGVIMSLAVINLNSAGAGDWTGSVQGQLRWIALGAIVMFIVTALDYRVIYRAAYVAYGFGVFLLVLVPFFGVEVNNAKRWLPGIGEFRLQPSEVMKVLLIIGIARYLHDLPPKEQKSLRHLIVPYAMVVLPTAFIIKQPDLGTGVMLLLIATSVLAVTELRLKGMLVVLSVGVLAFVVSWSYLEGYQRERVNVWLNPELYADDEGYQTTQGLISVGNGGFFGRGIDQGTQNVLHFLPERFTDFPFAVFAEEWGFVGCTLLLVFYMSLVLWAINLASQARDRFGALVCSGVAALFFWHIVINMGMVLQLAPVVGITLPFFSRGGSNVLTMMIGLGMLMSVSRSRHPRY